MSLQDPADAWDTPHQQPPLGQHLSVGQLTSYYLSLHCAELSEQLTATTHALDTAIAELEESHAMIDQLTNRINTPAATA